MAESAPPLGACKGCSSGVSGGEETTGCVYLALVSQRAPGTIAGSGIAVVELQARPPISGERVHAYALEVRKGSQKSAQPSSHTSHPARCRGHGVVGGKWARCNHRIWLKGLREEHCEAAIASKGKMVKAEGVVVVHSNQHGRPCAQEHNHADQGTVLDLRRQAAVVYLKREVKKRLREGSPICVEVEGGVANTVFNRINPKQVRAHTRTHTHARTHTHHWHHRHCAPRPTPPAPGF